MVTLAMAVRQVPVAKVVKPAEAVKVAMPAKRAGVVLAEKGHGVVKEVMPIPMETVLSRRRTVVMAEVPVMHAEVTMDTMGAKASGAIMA